MLDDYMVAVFPSRFKQGKVEMWYCPHSRTYRMEYNIKDNGNMLDGMVCYSDVMPDELGVMLSDAYALARTPLDARD